MDVKYSLLGPQVLKHLYNLQCLKAFVALTVANSCFLMLFMLKEKKDLAVEIQKKRGIIPTPDLKS